MSGNNAPPIEMDSYGPEIDAFNTVNVEVGMHRVRWHYEGEGRSGDYDDTDENDVPLLRFSCEWLDACGEWLELEGGSYCTQMPISSSLDHLLQGAARILCAIKGVRPTKRALERLSWMKPDDF